MKSPHLLRTGANPRKLKENLVNVIDAGALDAIESEIRMNAAQLFSLGLSHYRFAARQNNRAWRQKISRLYCAAFNVSRSVTVGDAGRKYVGLILDYGFYTGIRAAQSVDLFNKQTERVAYKHLRKLPIFEG
jgi:hypothetical protein